jgi:hypothetical protein
MRKGGEDDEVKAGRYTLEFKQEAVRPDGNAVTAYLLQQFQLLALSGRRCLPPRGPRIFIATKSKLFSGKSNLYR